MSKAFASFAAMRLQEHERLSIDDLVRQHLPWFEVRSEFEPIRLWHLMTHTAGIVNGTDWTGEGEYEIRSLRESMASAPPGTLYDSSNAGYRRSGWYSRRLEPAVADVLARELFEPLGMESAVDRSNADRPRQAPGHVPTTTTARGGRSRPDPVAVERVHHRRRQHRPTPADGPVPANTAESRAGDAGLS